MSTHDVPGAKPENHDRLAAGCWAEHDDGSLILVEGVEGGTVVYSMFDVDAEPVQEYRDAMPEKGFKTDFSWKPGSQDVDNEMWVWHDKTPFPWERVMQNFPPGARTASAVGTISAAQRLAERLGVRAQGVVQRDAVNPLRTGRDVASRIKAAIDALFDGDQ